jgi:hypothetical protein
VDEGVKKCQILVLVLVPWYMHDSEAVFISSVPLAIKESTILWAKMWNRKQYHERT